MKAPPTDWTVFVADAHPGTADAVASAMTSLPGRGRALRFRNAKELLRRLAYMQPDVLLIDVAFPGFDALTALRTLDGAVLPIALLARDTREDAQAAMEGLLAGARDVFVKRHRTDAVAFSGGVGALARRLSRLTRREAPPDEPPPAFTEPGCAPVCPYGAKGNAARWVRVLASGDGLGLGAPVGDMPGGAHRVAFAMGTLSSINRLAGGLLLPDRAGCPLLIRVPHAARWSRAIQDALSRRWNRAILDLQAQEHLRCGQWRILPGRSLVRLANSDPSGYEARQCANRIAHEDRAAALQLEALTRAPRGSLTVLATEVSGPAWVEPVAALLARDQIVLLHIQAAREIRRRLEALPAAARAR